jgi:hypothetical protein
MDEACPHERVIQVGWKRPHPLQLAWLPVDLTAKHSVTRSKTGLATVPNRKFPIGSMHSDDHPYNRMNMRWLFDSEAK